METADPVDLITTVGLALVLLSVGVVAWQGRDDILAIVKTIVGRYASFRWYGAQGDAALHDAPLDEDEAPEFVMESRQQADEAQTDRQTEQTDPVSALHNAVDSIQIDRTRPALIRVLVLAGWDVGRIRATLKGDNGAIGEEVAAARTTLNLDTPQRTFISREQKNGKLEEREIPI